MNLLLPWTVVVARMKVFSAILNVHALTNAVSPRNLDLHFPRKFQLVNKRNELVDEMDDQERAIEDDEETEMKVARKVPELTADKSCVVM